MKVDDDGFAFCNALSWLARDDPALEKKLPDDKFIVVHDESKFLRKQREFWEAVLSRASPPAVVGQDRRTFEFPLPVKELRLEDSQKFPQLQVAELVASSARAHANGLVMGRNPFLDALFDAGLYEALAGGVWPTDAVTPRDLERKTQSSVTPPPTSRASCRLKALP